MVTNYATGHIAEQYAASYLENEGYKIIDLNWKTPRCEVDVICRKDDVIFFVEVKYRKNDAQGMGIDYITPTKLRQMQFAAESWVHVKGWRGEYSLAALELTGPNYTVTDYITDLFG
jgi:Holliday junction resolvase-like predicted endonuclease